MSVILKNIWDYSQQIQELSVSQKQKLGNELYLQKSKSNNLKINSQNWYEIGKL